MSGKKPFKALALAAVFAAGTLAATTAEAVKVGPVEDPIRVVKILKGQPIIIGAYYVTSGPDSQVGIDQDRGARIRLAGIGNELLGHPIKYIAEDGQCNPEGAQTAATKLAANQQMVVVAGGSCSSECTVTAPILWKAGIPQVGVSCSSPVLTKPDRGAAYDGFVRVMFNDGWMGPMVADYIKNVVSGKTLGTIHDGSIFGQTLVRQVEASFKELGGEVCASEAIQPTDVEMRPMLTSIATCSPDWIYAPLFLAAAAHVQRQIGAIAGLENTKMMGMDAVVTKDFLAAAGTGAIGYVLATTAMEDEAKGAGYGNYLENYREMFGEDPIHFFGHYAYDAMGVALAAVERAAVQDDAGNTYIPISKLRDELFATKNHEGLTGKLTCDQYGDCGVYTLGVYEYVDDSPDSFSIGTNPKRIFPDKFE